MDEVFIEVDCYQKNKAGNLVCGDSFMSQKLKGEGRIISVLSDAESPARLDMMIAGVTHPTIMTMRCCRAIGMEYLKPGNGPSSWNSASLLLFMPPF